MSAGAASSTPVADRRCPRCGEMYPSDYSVCPRDATPLLLPGSDEDALVGQILADTYEVVAPIAEGGMGRVYRAKHKRLGREFAIKIMHSELSRVPDAVTRFRREATTAALVRSPFVAQVFDVDVTGDGRPYLVQELLEGEELGEMLDREGPLPVPRAAEIARQLCRAVGAAHAVGVVHRDLKPDNVMLVRDPEGSPVVKVVDFGIAKTLGSGPSLTRTGIVMGTPSYMAPEQAAGATDVDHRADVYAIGSILYHMLTGRKPFSSDDVATTLAMVLRDEPERPTTLRGDIPTELELVVQRAMSKLPEERYPTAPEMERALKQFAGSLGESTQRSARQAAGIDTGAATVYPDDLFPATNVRSARSARFRLVVFTSSLTAWLWIAIAALTGDAIRAVTLTPLTAVEKVLAVVLGAAVSLPMLVAWLRYLGRGPWRNTPLVTSLAGSLGRILAYSLCCFGLMVAASRFVYFVVMSERMMPGTFVSAAWGMAVVVVTGPALVGALRRRRR